MKIFSLGIILTLLTVCCHQQTSKNGNSQIPQNTIRIGIAGNPDRINPILSRNAYATQIQSKIFLPLLAYDPVSLQLAPCLAQSLPKVVELEKDKTQYTFEIHPQAIWDNGSPVTANDYIFTLKVVFNPWINSPGYRNYLSVIESVAVDTDNPKKFKVIANKEFLLKNVAVGNFEIYPAYHYDPESRLAAFELEELKQMARNGEDPRQKKLQDFAQDFSGEKFSLNSNFISGCGAYTLTEWIPDQQITLSKKENWWGETLEKDYPSLLAKPTTLLYKIIQDRFSALSLLKGGKLDVLSNIPPADFKNLQEDTAMLKQFQFLSPPVLQYYHLAINNEKIRDVNVRRAIASLIDTKKIIHDLAYDYGAPIIGPIHPGKSYYNDTLALVPYDLEKAKQYLSNAGWEDLDGDGIREKRINGRQKKLSLSLTINPNSTTDKNFALTLQNNAKPAGIMIDVNSKSFNQALDDFKAGNYELFMMVLRQSISVDNPFTSWHSSSIGQHGRNHLRFTNSEMDLICEKIQYSSEVEVREDLYRRFQEIIYQEQPAVFLYTFKERIAINKSIIATGTALRPGYQENAFYFE